MVNCFLSLFVLCNYYSSDFNQQVEDFEDLSPYDQKALLRKTVSELVMLGFARASIPYDGALIHLFIDTNHEFIKINNSRTFKNEFSENCTVL